MLTARSMSRFTPWTRGAGRVARVDSSRQATSLICQDIALSRSIYRRVRSVLFLERLLERLEQHVRVLRLERQRRTNLEHIAVTAR